LCSTTGNSSKPAVLTITPVRLIVHTGAYHLGGGTEADQEGAGPVSWDKTLWAEEIESESERF
jgi:hypothetical protein